MENTPRGLRKHIAIFGKTNAGKSSLFNQLIGQDNAIVSDKAGTTTDPVLKGMELLPFGPVTLIDTAGLDDATPLGKQRMQKTKEYARRADVGIFVIDITESIEKSTVDSSVFAGEKLWVFTKCDLVPPSRVEEVRKKHPKAIFVSNDRAEDIEQLKQELVQLLQKIEKDREETLLGDILPYGSTVVMVVPVDSEAPKGRLILPQVQLIRDCLDHGIKAYVTRETELEAALQDLKKVDLVVTDSQAFHLVNQIVPQEIPLTSFSMLLARQKGDFSQLLKGAEAVERLDNGDVVLILEGCTHNQTHEDIGRVKIPKLLRKYTGKVLHFEFYSGYDVPKSLDGYAFAVMCGSCMINEAEVRSRLKLLSEAGISATNYGVILAYLNGILDRCTEIFKAG